MASHASFSSHHSSSSKLMLDQNSHNDDEDAGQDSFLGRWESDEHETSWEASVPEALPLPVVRKQYVIKPRMSFMNSSSSSISHRDEPSHMPSTPRTASTSQVDALWKSKSPAVTEAPPSPARIQGILRPPATPGTGRSVRFGLRLYDDGDQSRLSASTTADSRDSSTRSAATIVRDHHDFTQDTFDEATLERVRLAQSQLTEDESMQAVEMSLHSEQWESRHSESTSQVEEQEQEQHLDQEQAEGVQELSQEEEREDEADEDSSPEASREQQRTATSSPTLRITATLPAAPPSPPSRLTAGISTTDMSDLLDASLPSNLDENETVWNLLPPGKQSPRSAPATRHSPPNTVRADKTSTGSMVSSASIDSANLSFSESFLKREMARAIRASDALDSASPSGHFASPTTVSCEAQHDPSSPALSAALDESETLAQQTLPESETLMQQTLNESFLPPSSPSSQHQGDHSTASTSDWATPAGSIAASHAGTMERSQKSPETRRHVVTPRSSASPPTSREDEDSPSAARAARRAPPHVEEWTSSSPSSSSLARKSPPKPTTLALPSHESNSPKGGRFAGILGRFTSPSPPTDALEQMLAQVNALDMTHTERTDLLQKRARAAEESADCLRAALEEEKAFRSRAETAAQNSIRKLAAERSHAEVHRTYVEGMMRELKLQLESEMTPVEEVEQLRRQVELQRREHESELRDMQVKLHMAEQQHTRNASRSPMPGDVVSSDVQKALDAARAETREECQRDADVRVYALQMEYDRQLEQIQAQFEPLEAGKEVQRQEREEREAALVQLQHELDLTREDAEGRIAELEAKLREQRGLHQSLARQLDDAQDARAESEECIAKLERGAAAAQRADAERQSQSNRVAELGAALQRAKQLNPQSEHVAELREALEQAQRELELLRAQRAELETKLESGQIALEEAQQSLSACKAATSQLSAALSKEQREVQELKAQRVEYESRLAAAERLASQNQQDTEAAADERTRLESLLRGANAARQESDARCTELASRLQDAREQQDALRSDVLERQTRIHEQDKQLQLTQRELNGALLTAKSNSGTKELIAEFEVQIEGASLELEAEQRRRTEALGLAEEMQGRMGSLEAKFEALRERAAMLERENADRGLTIAKLTKVKERLETDNQNYSIALSAKQQELSLLKRSSRQSTTPKVAAPVTPAAEPRSTAIVKPRRVSMQVPLAPTPRAAVAAARENNMSTSSVTTTAVMGPPTARPTARRQSTMTLSGASSTASASRPIVAAPRRSLLASASTREASTTPSALRSSTRTPLTTRRLSVSSTNSARSVTSDATVHDAKRGSTSLNGAGGGGGLLGVSLRSENDTPMDLSELKTSTSSVARTSARRVSVALSAAAAEKENEPSGSTSQRNEASLRALPRAPLRNPSASTTTASTKLSAVRGMDSFLERRAAVRQRASMMPTPTS